MGKNAGNSGSPDEKKAIPKEKAAITWQAQKSSLTRDRITIATLECIVEHGYARTTMARIAKIAGVSQGSMQYHFSTKMEAMKASINYLNLKRLNDHQQDLANVPPGVDPMDYSVDAYWRHLNEGHFIAYQELVVAARTEPELAAVLKPAYQKFVRSWREYALSRVPEWRKARSRFDLLSDLGQYQMEGLAFGRLNEQISEKRIQKVLELTKKQLRHLVDNPVD